MSRQPVVQAALANPELFEEMYALYSKGPHLVPPAWKEAIEALSAQEKKEIVQAPVILGDEDSKIFRLVQAYREFGHLGAAINPLEDKPAEPEQLNLKALGFTPEDEKKIFPTLGLLKSEKAPLSEIVKRLKEIYSGSIGYEYEGFQNPEFETWLQNRIEKTPVTLSIDEKQKILEQLNKSELFESFLHTKYVGQKRFSLEGAETFIPMLATLINKGASEGVKEFVLGMAHRGRLNVLCNIMNKSYTDVFAEFDENYVPASFEGSGDVKYHKGFCSEVQTSSGKVKVTLCPNPSHLESVDPVVEGQVKAKQVKAGDNPKKALAVLIHGDAALSGQGVVYETMQFYGLKGYSTGGSVHIVINNQIGFTTLPKESRSTRYCTDIAKAFGAPVFHLNGDDPEACVIATLLALEIRQKFHIDVFLDLYCYRKYGHNEGDEPAFTQPLEYKKIRAKKSVREIYRDSLVQQSVVEKFMAESLEGDFKKALQQALRTPKPSAPDTPKTAPEEIHDPSIFKPIDTSVSLDTLLKIAQKITTIPSGLQVHPKLENLLKERLAMAKGERSVDWGMAEMLAYGSLLWEGVPVRLSGQDTCRGTFSHRHALWKDQVKESEYFPLQHLKEDQGRCDVINSPLSEFASLGFEFGYSIAAPEALVLWEAQFGDFCNGAQVIIDQYIATTEQKWGQNSGLALLLPHGYEGQGPEHSSGRLERFLTLAGNDNMFIANPTLPAQIFHLLRRHMKRNEKKPLIVFTPKGLLRHPECVSPIEDLSKGSFKEVIDDQKNYSKAKKLVFCSGRVYYDINEKRMKDKVDDVAIIRIEQLYPLNQALVKELIANYTSAEKFYWVQEEPCNMGAWSYIRPLLSSILPKGKELTYIGRSRSASPAAGSYALHKKEYAAIITAIFADSKQGTLDLAQHLRA